MNIQRGFTLAESMIALAILTLLAAMTIPVFQTSLIRNKLAENV